MTTLVEYFSSVAAELKIRSDKMRQSFSGHRPSVGSNREDIVARFLRDHLAERYGVSTGLVISLTGDLSSQADVIVYDAQTSRPLHFESPCRLHPVESVLSVIEVKTRIDPEALRDSVAKCRKFKALPREFDPLVGVPRVRDSLFCIWAFEGPAPATLKERYLEAVSGVPVEEQPDFLILQDSLLISGGSYRVFVKLGQQGSSHYQAVISRFNGDLKSALGNEVEVMNLGEHALLCWIIWFSSWLKGAVPRGEMLQKYLPQNYVFGNTV